MFKLPPNQGHTTLIYLLWPSSRWIVIGTVFGWESRLCKDEEKTYFPDDPIMCRGVDKAMITPSSHLNTNSVLSVEYKISKSHLDAHLGSISFFLTSASPQTCWSRRCFWPLSSYPWLPPPCPARDRSPGGGCWCGPRDISSWCHYHPSSVTNNC